MTRSSIGGSTGSSWCIGDYLVEQRLGAGGSARVYRARSATGEQVAVKLLSPGAALDDPRAGDRLRREIAALARLEHPRIVALRAHGEDPELGPYLVMPLLAGRTLRELLAGWRPSPPAAIQLVGALAGATAAIHAAGLVHRDLKPENVMCTHDGRLVIVDLGLALADGHSRYTEEGAVAGSAPYMAPEQIEGAEITAATDAWALAVILYELIAGRRPFQRAAVREEVAAILAGHAPRLDQIERRADRELAELVARGLARDPTARPSAAELAERLPVDDRALAALLGPDRAATEADLVEREVARLTAFARGTVRGAPGSRGAARDYFLGLRAIDQCLAYRPGDPELTALAAELAEQAPAAAATVEPAGPQKSAATTAPHVSAEHTAPTAGRSESADHAPPPRSRTRRAIAIAGLCAVAAGAAAWVAISRARSGAPAPPAVADVRLPADAPLLPRLDARAPDPAGAPTPLDLATWPGLPSSVFPVEDAPIDHRLLDTTHIPPNAPAPCRERRWSECEAALDAAVAGAPGDLAARASRGHLRYRLGRLRAAHDDLLAVLHAAPHELEVIRDLAHLADYLGRTTEARDLLSTVAAARPDDPDVWLDLAQTQPEDAALASLDRAAAIAPRAPRVVELRCVLFTYYAHPEAPAICRDAAAISPSSAKIWSQLAAGLLRAGEPTEALGASERALGLAPEDPIVLANRGAILDELGRADDALDAFRRACRLGHTGSCTRVGRNARR